MNGGYTIYDIRFTRVRDMSRAMGVVEGGFGTALGAGERLAFVCERLVRAKAPEGRRTPGRCREVRGFRAGAQSADWKSAIQSRF